jgi:predicted nucleic acid-binding protein
MIVADASVWVDHLNNDVTPQVVKLRDLFGRQLILVGDLTYCEVLQGVRSEREARSVEAVLRAFDSAAMSNPDLAVRAAANYRALRGRGITIRKTIDLIIGTFCIENHHALLHDDRDFEPMERYLGLVTI